MVLGVIFWLCGCSPGPDAWLGAAIEIEVPASDGSRFPDLSPEPAGEIVVSWLEPHEDNGFALKFAHWSSGGWRPGGAAIYTRAFDRRGPVSGPAQRCASIYCLLSRLTKPEPAR